MKGTLFRAVDTQAERDSLQPLLACLSPDPKGAHEKLTQVHMMLVKRFECNGVSRPEEMARLTLTKVSQERILDIEALAHQEWSRRNSREMSATASEGAHRIAHKTKLRQKPIESVVLEVAQEEATKLLNDELSQENLDRILTRLDPDPVRAATRFEELHDRLEKFFSSHCCQDSASLADRTLNRAARKLRVEPVRNLTEFVMGIAKNVIKESWAIPERTSFKDGLTPPESSQPVRQMQSSAAPADDRELWLDALEDCLRELPNEKRILVLSFHNFGGEKLHKVRKFLATQKGVSPGALRTEVCRLRDDLEDCVRRKLARFSAKGTS
jgi:DNA-directed RNA polymerase specialized sigma24 family protein